MSTIPTLSAGQKAITSECERNLMVEAGAGSGKTTALISKVLHEIGVDVGAGAVDVPLSLDEIAAITFTRKATAELKDRLRSEFLQRAEAASGIECERWVQRAHEVDQARIGTIDAFAGRMIRDYGGLAGIESSFDILEPGDTGALYHSVASRALHEHSGSQEGHAGARFLLRHFGLEGAIATVVGALYRADLLVALLESDAETGVEWGAIGIDLNGADRALEEHAGAVLAFLGLVHDALVDHFDREGVLDHTHVVLRAAEMAKLPKVRRAFSRDVSLLLVDEHQDTSRAQASLVFRLAGLADGVAAEPATRIVLVGDPKQGIYGFRGADITMWEASRNLIENGGGEYVPLADNHRSRPSLVRFFDHIFSVIMGKGGDEAESRYETPFRPLAPSRATQGGEPDILVPGEEGPEAAAEVVAARVADMLSRPHDFPVFVSGGDGGEKKRPIEARDIAILSRNLKGVAEHYEGALRRRGIDSYVFGGRGLYARPEVQDVASALQALVAPHDNAALVAFLRSPLGGVDDRSLAYLAGGARGGEGVDSLFEAMARASDLILEGDGLRRVQRARALLDDLLAVRDRAPHDQLIEMLLDRAGYRGFLAGAQDAPVGLRNIDKLLRVARAAAASPLSRFVAELGDRVRRADPEDEAPLYSQDDDLVTITTIHKAKGLEWPYVFVVGLDDGLFWKVNSRHPVLTPDVGVAIPTQVHIGSTSSPAIKAGAWDHYTHEQTLREYAEAKRLFYVACTRARDHLTLVGALNATSCPRKLTGSLRTLHQKGAEHWLRYLFRPLAKGGDRAPYGPHAEEVRILRHPNIPVPAPSSQAGFDWRAVEASVEGRGGEELRRRIANVHDQAPIRVDLGASEILKFDMCPLQHLLGYRGGLSTPHIEFDAADDVVNQILPEKRGDILHDYLREHRVDWGDDRQLFEMQKAVLRHIPMTESAAQDNAAELLRHARNYLSSEWYRRVVEAEEVHKEVPCVLRLEDGTRVSMTIDLLFREADGWRILDFKTGLFRGLEHKIVEAVAKRSREYEVQAAIYSLAADAALDGPVKEFVFFYTAPAEAYTFSPSESWLAGVGQRVQGIVRRIRDGDYGEAPYCTCGHCDYPSGEGA